MSEQAQSSATDTVTENVVNNTRPVVSGVPQQGQTLTTTNGTWTSDYSLTYAYQWLRCDASGNNCVPIQGATSNSYVLQTTDVGHEIRSQVTATEVLTPPPSPGNFGGLLPPRLPESTGAVTNVNSMSALMSALGSVPNGSIINITTSLNGGNQIYTMNRVASPSAPITITCNPGVVLTDFNMWYLNNVAYVRFRGLEFTGMNGDTSIKPTASSHDIEIDSCHFHHMRGQGILITNAAYNIQIWNTKIHNCGDEANLDHGIYWSHARGNCVIANCLIYDNWAYNVQLYSDVQNLIVTCCTIDGGIIQPDNRGGLVLGSESQGTTTNCKFYGLIITNAPYTPGFHIYNPPLGSGNQAFDSLGFGNAGGDFESASGMTYTNCTHADPLYVSRGSKNFHLSGGSPAIDKVQSARYGYIPPYDIDGNPRVTADAGCYAA